MPPKSGCRPLALPRICQISEYHCGPAVLQMLLAHRGVVANQQHLTELADVAATIATHGTRVDQLAHAVAWLRAGVCLWYKDKASAEDLVAVVCRCRCPAGVEWQGFFEDREEDEDVDSGDYGHYSIVTRIDRRRGLITLRDPYPDFCHEDRVFRLEWFIDRWWDVNVAPAAEISAPRLVEDRRMLFIVTRERARFPASMGMKRG